MKKNIFFLKLAFSKPIKAKPASVDPNRSQSASNIDIDKSCLPTRAMLSEPLFSCDIRR